MKKLIHKVAHWEWLPLAASIAIVATPLLLAGLKWRWMLTPFWPVPLPVLCPA